MKKKKFSDGEWEMQVGFELFAFLPITKGQFARAESFSNGLSDLKWYEQLLHGSSNRIALAPLAE